MQKNPSLNQKSCIARITQTIQLFKSKTLKFPKPEPPITNKPYPKVPLD